MKTKDNGGKLTETFVFCRCHYPGHFYSFYSPTRWACVCLLHLKNKSHVIKGILDSDLSSEAG